MTIQELAELRKQETSGRLRMPNCAKNVENIEELRQVNAAIEFLARSDKRSFLLLVKMLIKGIDCITDLKGIGTKNCPYEIETSFGSGSFYSVAECFELGVVPEDIEYKQCFHNCYLAVTKGYIKNCEILSGIAYRGGEDMNPFLHSVVRVENKILDFNYNLCIDEELYKKLFNFEIFNTLSSNRVLAGYPVLKKYHKLLNEKGFTTMHAVFAWDDLIDFIYDKNRRKNEKVEILK